MSSDFDSAPRLIDRWAKRFLHRALEGLQHGRLALREGGTEICFGDVNAPPELRATVNILTPRLYRAVLLGGGIGAAEAYMAGWWTADDPAVVVQILTLNMESADRMDKASVWLTRPVQWIHHLLRSNTLKGSRRNIAAVARQKHIRRIQARFYSDKLLKRLAE